MQNTFTGCLWEDQPGNLPRFYSCSYNVRGRMGGGVNRCPGRFWRLFYSFDRAENYKLKRNGRWWERNAGLAFLLPPGVRQYNDDSHTIFPVRVAFLLFEYSGSGGLKDFIDEEHGHARFWDPSGLLGRTVKTMCEVGYRRAEEGYLPIMSRFYEVVDQLISSRHLAENEYTVIDEAEARTEPSLGDQVRQYLRANLYSRVRLPDIAKELSMSLSSLSHRHKDETGESILTRLNRMRMDVVKARLLAGESVKTIASSFSYCDEHYLSTAFKRVVGVSPRAYVRQIAETL